MPLPGAVSAVLIDIEGTTTPVSFVYDRLFPYARARLDEACAAAETDPRVAKAVEQLHEEYDNEPPEEGQDRPAFGNGAPYAAWLMDRDRKSTGLKALQGLIWEDGYRYGELRGEVFEDVPPALEAWREAGTRLRVFSSGSVLAQRLLFSTTAYGDLTPYFEGFHDTVTGPKKESASYVRIAEAFSLPPDEILFLSDVADELDAASEVGMRTGLFLRAGNPQLESPPAHPTYSSFAELV